MSCVSRHFSFLHCSQPLLLIFFGHVWFELGQPTKGNPTYVTPPRKPSSDASSPIPRPTGTERPWCTKISPGRQTASPPPTGRCRSLSRHTKRTHAASQSSRPYVPTVQGGGANTMAERCQNFDILLQCTFGSPSPPHGVGTTDPERVLALAWATFQSQRRPPQKQQHQQQRHKFKAQLCLCCCPLALQHQLVPLHSPHVNAYYIFRVHYH